MVKHPETGKECRTLKADGNNIVHGVFNRFRDLMTCEIGSIVESEIKDIEETVERTVKERFNKKAAEINRRLVNADDPSHQTIPEMKEAKAQGVIYTAQTVRFYDEIKKEHIGNYGTAQMVGRKRGFSETEIHLLYCAACLDIERMRKISVNYLDNALVGSYVTFKPDMKLPDMGSIPDIPDREV